MDADPYSAWAAVKNIQENIHAEMAENIAGILPELEAAAVRKTIAEESVDSAFNLSIVLFPVHFFNEQLVYPQLLSSGLFTLDRIQNSC